MQFASSNNSTGSNRINVAYYVTGHGLGHATRSLELIRCLLNTNEFNIHTVSYVKEEFFVENLESSGISIVDSITNDRRFTHNFRSLDTGAKQLDVFRVDPLASLENYYQYTHCKRQDLVGFEVNWLQQNKIRLVLVDGTPLGCAVGKLCGIKTILLSNFSWDFVFKGMLELVKEAIKEYTGIGGDDTTGIGSSDTVNVASLDQIARFEELVEQSQQDTISCDCYLQLPGATPLPPGLSVDTQLRRGPLIARGVRDTTVREQYIPSSTCTGTTSIINTASNQGLESAPRRKLLLLGFGGFATQWKLEDKFLPEGWVCLVLGAKPEEMPSDRFIAMSYNCYVPDLIYAADAVLGKIGYGFVSECLRAGTVLVYVPRSGWPEEPYLEKLLCEEYSGGLRMTLEDFHGGNWEPYLESAAGKKNSWQLSEEHNPDKATDRIIDIIKDILRL